MPNFELSGAEEENSERVRDTVEFFVYDELTTGGPNGTGPPLDDGVSEPLLRVIVELIPYDEDYVDSADRLVLLPPRPQETRETTMPMVVVGAAARSKDLSSSKTASVLVDSDIDNRLSTELHVHGKTYTVPDELENSAIVVDDTRAEVEDDGRTSTRSSSNTRTNRQITVCRASRCASRVFVMSNTSVRWRVINKALNKLRKRPGFKRVYDKRRWTYIVRSFGSRNFMVDIPFAFSNNVDV